MRNAVSRSFLPVLSLLALGLVASASAQQSAAEMPELEVTRTEAGLQVPDTLEAGFYRFVYTDEVYGPDGTAMYEVSLDRINDESTTLDEVQAGYATMNEAMMGGGEVGAGEAIEQLAALITPVGGPGVIVELKEGHHIASAVGQSLEDSEFVTFTVTPASSDVQGPEADLTVNMTEFAYDIPEEVEAGQQVWRIENAGGQVHHLVLFRIKEGKTLDEVIAFLESEQGEEPVEYVRSTAVIGAGQSNYVEYDLAPGEYLAICFLPDYETGELHAMLGMMDTFTVAGN